MTGGEAETQLGLTLSSELTSDSEPPGHTPGCPAESWAPVRLLSGRQSSD